MSKVILQLSNVGKKYNLFHDKKSRILNLLNIPVSQKKYIEFWALRDISFELKEGERLGLVGRNGAGKSTMLKLIAGIMKPTLGEINVHANIQALLELGTGFHPEFTGKQNIYSSLGYYGITGKKADSLYDEIVDFSELERFINMPLKTYSSGMYSRLAFSISTSIIKAKDEPGILIIDEVLGAGDAYFSAKCAALMKLLTSNGASVLFVSHDISAVQMICNRAVWIERGSMIMDGDPLEVSKEYAASIRKQEDLRLRAVNMKLHRSQIKEVEHNDLAEHESYVMRLITKHANQPHQKHPVFEISLYQGNDLIDVLRVGEPQDNDASRNIYLLTTKGFMNWSDPDKFNNQLVRHYSNNQGKYIHAPFIIKIPKILGINPDLSIRIKHACAPDEEVYLDIYHQEKYVRLGGLESVDKGQAWREDSFYFPEKFYQDKEQPIQIEQNNIIEEDNTPDNAAISINEDRLYGDKLVIIKHVEFRNRENEPHAVFLSQEYMSVRLSWTSKEYLENLIFVVCIYALDGRVVSQVLSEPVNLKKLGYLSGETMVSYNPLLLGEGEYVVSVGVFTSQHPPIGNQLTPHYVIDREFRLKIQKPADMHYEFGAVCHPVKWSYINRETSSVND